MSTTIAADTGRRGEQIATDYLRQHGYEIESLNWRQGRYELDIVARKWEVLHFIEVKTRKANGLTPPEAAMTSQKQQALLHAARAYLAYSGWDGEVAFDLVAVNCHPDGSVTVRLIEQALETHW